MGKRSSFARLPQDAYNTPLQACLPLLAQLPPKTRYIEPCAGNGHLIAHLKAAGHRCAGRYDLPDDARTKRYAEARPGTFFITNPPWARPALHAIIENLSSQLPTWLLIDSDWAHTRQATPFMPRLRIIVSVGHCRWIADSPFTGKDNCAWPLLFRPRSGTRVINFIGRIDSTRIGAERNPA